MLRPALTTVVGVLAAATLVAGSLAACSSSTGGADSPEHSVETFFHAIGNKDPGAACSVVSTGGAVLSAAGLDQCRVGFDKVLGSVADQADIALLKNARVTGATVDGDKAHIRSEQITQVPAGFENDIDLVRISGRWYIDSKADPDTSPTPT